MKKYIQGERVSFTIQLAIKDSDGIIRPFPLTGNTEIVMLWESSAGVVRKNRVAATTGVVVVGADADGKVKGTLEVADTDAQAKTTAGNIEITVTKGVGDVTKFKLKNAFQVDEKVALP